MEILQTVKLIIAFIILLLCAYMIYLGIKQRKFLKQQEERIDEIIHRLLKEDPTN